MRIRLFLAMSVVVALVVGLTVVAYDRLDAGSVGGDQVVSGSVPSDSPPQVVPGPGQIEVHGTVTTVLIADAVLQPREVPTPLTITSERGFGNGGELTGVEVDGAPSTIVWDGGRPFTLSSGGGALRLDPADVALGPEGLLVGLGRGNHALTPGTYRLDTPVAVGSEGIATPRDAVTFEAADISLFEGRGDAYLVLGPGGPRRFVGPGQVILGGTFEVTDAVGSRSETGLAVTHVAAFDLTFTPDGAGGWAVDGIIDEPVEPSLPEA